MASQSSGANKTMRDKARAAQMKRDGVVRTTGRCCNCYKIVTVESVKTANKHIGFCR